MGDGHVDDLPPAPAAILAAPKLHLVVADRQKRAVNSNREVRLANVISLLEHDLRIESGVAEEHLQRSFCRFSCRSESFLLR